MAQTKYHRILLKLSGEALMGGRRTGIDAATLASIADEVGELPKMGVQTAIVIGGGNIFRGVTAATEGIDRVAGDHMGMLATVINALALQDALERRSVQTRVMTAISMSEVASRSWARVCRTEAESSTSRTRIFLRTSGSLPKRTGTQRWPPISRAGRG